MEFFRGASFRDETTRNLEFRRVKKSSVGGWEVLEISEGQN